MYPMRLFDVLRVLDELAPLRYAEAWDNVGLLAGDPASEVQRALVTVDYTPRVDEEARALGADLVVAYHPPIFAAVKRVPHDAPWASAIRRGVALYSMHTALDVAHGGTNDVLADACGIAGEGRAPLRAHEGKAVMHKLVTFVPHEALEAVSAALFDAGAGRIGAYSRCSFRLEGTGTFFGEEGTNPAVGEAGKLERAREVRLETVVPRGSLEAVVTALRGAHPYEEPAFDLLRLASPPEGVGLGRVGDVEPCPRRTVIDRVKARLGLSHVLTAGELEGHAKRVAVAAGAGGELLGDAMRAGADVFVTGELRHHDALIAARSGLLVLATLHSNSERAAVRSFAGRVGDGLDGVTVHVSEADADPFRVT
jgi:dinuclear metal center YbgI/SA1388 family protein